MDKNALISERNFFWLQQNAYPGRGIIAGIDETYNFLIQIYWIMGRSENSRNRIFKADRKSGRLYTEAADPTKVQDPSLIFYNAMRERGSYFIVSNGDQTDTVAEFRGSLDLNVALETCTYEPDWPNFTQRITAISACGGGISPTQFSILRKSAFGNRCDRLTYSYHSHPGFGYCITTYSSDGDPLPPFQGDPLLMPLKGEIEDIATMYWNALDEDNRVSLAVKFIHIGTNRSHIHIINKFSRIPFGTNPAGEH